jgi:hypothetical protein
MHFLLSLLRNSSRHSGGGRNPDMMAFRVVISVKVMYKLQHILACTILFNHEACLDSCLRRND